MTTSHAFARAVIRRVREESEKGTSGRLAAGSGGIRFPLGKLYATPGALSALAENGVSEKPYSVQYADDQASGIALALPYVRRHAGGDWGDVDAEDRNANDEALKCGSRVLSAYELATGERLWIITETDRSATTVLLSTEY